MSRTTISLKARVRYEGRVRETDRRATKGADIEKIPNPIWYTIGQVLRSKFSKPILKSRKPQAKAAPKPRVTAKSKAAAQAKALAETKAAAVVA